MPTFDSMGVPIYFEEKGAGLPVVLVHGFAADLNANWKVPGWIDLLAQSWRVIAMDCRGHGRSGKPYDPAAYSIETRALDVIRLMDYLELNRALLMGYSMGARISLEVVLRYAERIRAVVLGGIGLQLTGAENPRWREEIVTALLAPSIENAPPIARAFREFAEDRGNDLKALAACFAGDRPAVDPALLASIRVPTMVVIGSKDTLVGSADQLAAGIPGAELVTLEGRDHLTAPASRLYKESVLRFFAAAPA